MKYILNLPSELITAILENLYYIQPRIGSRDPDYNTLSACSLVSSQWTSPSQTLLFRQITFAKSRHFFSCHICIAPSPRTQILLSHLLVLNITLGPDSRSTDCVCTPSLFVTLLASLPRLYELILRVDGLSVFDELAFTTIKNFLDSTPSSIRALRIMDCGVQYRITYQLLKLFPGIRFLTLGTELTRAPPAETIPGLRLYQLILHRSLPQNIISWLLSSSQESLRILEMLDFPSATLKPVLETHAPHIRSLRFMRYSIHSSAIIKMCKNLQELIVLNVPPFFPFPELPDTLEHLGIINHTLTVAMDVGSIMAVIRTLPRLATFTCSENTWNQENFRSLRSMCAIQCIAVLPSAAGLWPIEDPIPVKDFPRRRSVSNFNVMMRHSGYLRDAIHNELSA